MLEFLHDQLDHDRVIEETDPGDAVGDQILGVCEVGEGSHDSFAVLPFKAPFLVVHHVDHRAQLFGAFDYEFRGFGGEFGQCGGGAGNQFVARLAIGPRLDLGQDSSEVIQILITQFERDFQGHGGRISNFGFSTVGYGSPALSLSEGPP